VVDAEGREAEWWVGRGVESPPSSVMVMGIRSSAADWTGLRRKDAKYGQGALEIRRTTHDARIEGLGVAKTWGLAPGVVLARGDQDEKKKEKTIGIVEELLFQSK